MLSIIRLMSGKITTGVVGVIVLLLLLVGPVSATEPRPPGPKDRCPVCGMSVEKYKNWIATVVFEDGEQVFFDGPKDLFRFLQDLEKYGHDADAISEVRVTDYYTTTPMKARDAFFVVGSDVMGPMGHEAVALRSESEAETFVRDHGGDKILRFDEVTEEEVPK
jgi:nitrous oxide reductase accessory protein NosL